MTARMTLLALVLLVGLWGDCHLQRVDPNDIKACYDEIFKGSMIIRQYSPFELSSMSIKDSSAIFRRTIGGKLDVKKCQIVPRPKLIEFMRANLANTKIGSCIRSGYDYYRATARYILLTGILDNRAVLATIRLVNHLEEVRRLCDNFS